MDAFSQLDTTWILFCAFLVMVMQAGFCLLETGLVRSKNSINVAFKNLSDFCLAACTYWVVGYALMYGESYLGFVGTSGFFFEHSDGNSAWFLYQLMFCGAATTIVGGALAERTQYTAYLAISVLIAGVFYPVAGHWIWGGVLEREASGWLVSIGFIDFAGGAAVHGLGGCLALAAVLVVGPRLGRFESNQSDKSSPLKGSNYPIATVGVVLLWFGWFGFNGGSAIGFKESISLIVVNTSLAAAAGGLTLIFWFLRKTGKPDIGGVLNGTLAGLVGVTAGAHLYTSLDSVFVGMISAAVVLAATELLERLQIDDVIGAFPVHGAAGLVGVLLVAILGDASQFPFARSVPEQLMVQLIGVAAIGFWAFAVAWLVFTALNKVLPLRVSAEQERLGLNVAEHNASTEVHDLLVGMSEQRRDGDFSHKVSADHHTETGQIANEYNKVLDRVRLEIQTREEAYQQLKEASHFQFIFENTSEGIIQLDLEGNVLQANPAAAQILGFVSVERLTSTLGPYMQNFAFTNPDAQAEIVDNLQHRGQVVDYDFEFERQVDGKTGCASCSVHSIQASGDRPACYLASFTDLADRRENEQLRIEKDSAESANKAKSQFLANMSHEIRTPLNGVTGMLELLSRTELDSFQRRYIEIAQNSAQSLLSVINDILDFSKIEAGKLELDSVEFQLQDLLADVVDIFASQTASKNIELVGNIPPSIPAWVVGDPERLRQVLINLMGNAVKFTEQGHVALSVTSLKASNDSAQIDIQIEDSGCGISKENLGKLFKSFTQADASTTRKYGGTGLGLTISRQLIELMGGDVSVESTVGKGSVFSITLTMPVVEKEARADKQLPASIAGTRVMVVDDHPVNLELMYELLIPFGLEVDCAESAEQAMQLLDNAGEDEAPYELFLLDFHMPDTDGLELSYLLREHPGGEDFKLIMLTSIDQLSSNDPGMENFNTSLVKPVRASRLFDSIAVALADKLVPEGKSLPSSVVESDSVMSKRDSARSASIKPKTVTKTTTRKTSGSTKKTAVAKQTAKKATAKKATTKKAVTKKAVAKKAVAKKSATKKSGNKAVVGKQLSAAKSKTVAAPVAEVPARDGSAPNILIVEDNPINQIVATEILMQAGFNVEVANDGAEGVDRIVQGGIDLVLMDCQMPVLDGFEATRKLREHEREEGVAANDQMPVIALTANALKGDREACLEAGMNDYVTKPLQPETLFKAMQQFVDLPDDAEQSLRDTGT